MKNDNVNKEKCWGTAAAFSYLSQQLKMLFFLIMSICR